MIVSVEPAELVALKRALGQQLAALRQAARVGQQQVAHKTGYSRSSVAHAEAGRQLLTRDFWKTADELVGAEGALLAGYEQVQAIKQEHEALSRQAELATALAEAQAVRATAAPPPVSWGETDRLALSIARAIVAALARVADVPAEGVAGPLAALDSMSSAPHPMPAGWEERLSEQLEDVLGEWVTTMNRRQLIQLLGWAAAIVAASPMSGLDADEQQRLTKAIAVPRRVDARVIDHIEAMLAHCKRQEDALGPQAVLRTVLAQRQLVDVLLAECPEPLRPRLLSVSSSMSSSIGIYFSNLNNPTRAMHYWDQARQAAGQARNSELAIYALCMMSHFASRQGKAHAGIDFAAAAQSLATQTDDPLLHACVAVESAIAYTVDGQHTQSMTEFDQAFTRLAAPSGHRHPESPVYWLHEGLVASHQSDCLLRHGKPAQAAAVAEKALHLFDTSLVGDLAFCTLRLGTARLLCGDIDEAARAVADAALLAAQSPSTRLTQEIHTTRARMNPWQHTQAIKTLDQQLAETGIIRRL